MEDERVVVITLSGVVQAEEVQAMRAETIAIVDRTGIPSWPVDLVAVEELVGGRPVDVDQPASSPAAPGHALSR